MPKNVLQACALPASPDTLYDMYLDPKRHAAFTGGEVVIEAKPGAPFSAFNGILTGRILDLQPKRSITQTWRSGNWPAEAIDSILTLTFWPDPEGGRIELAHINVSDEDFAGVSMGWNKFYWTPWRAYLEAQANP